MVTPQGGRPNAVMGIEGGSGQYNWRGPLLCLTEVNVRHINNLLNRGKLASCPAWKCNIPQIEVFHKAKPLPPHAA